jgi:glycosyltransferase involved in cell wall biosynthesis
VQALAELGYEVDLLSFPFGRDLQLPRINSIRCENPLKIHTPPIGFSLKKCILDASLTRTFERLLRTRRYDVVHAVEEAAYIAAALCPRFNVPFIYDMASAIPDELRRLPVLGSASAQRFLKAIEKRVLDRATHVVCSIGLETHVHWQAPDTPVKEWRFPAEWRPVNSQEVAQLRRSLDIEAKQRVLVYCGNFARYQGIELLLEAFGEAAQTERDLVLVGVGATEEERRRLLEKIDPSLEPNLRIITRRPRDQVPAYLAMADCLVSLRPVTDNLPLKVFDYMVSGRPIVATYGAAHEPVLNRDRAFLCDATPRAVADSILRLLHTPRLARARAEAAFNYARSNFGWQAFVGFVDDLYARVQQIARLSTPQHA